MAKPTSIKLDDDLKSRVEHLAEARRRLGERIACPKVSANARLHALLQAKDAKLHELGERWTSLKAQYAEKAGAMKAGYAEKRAEYAERAAHQIEDARAALAEMRRELQATLDLLDHSHAMVAV